MKIVYCDVILAPNQSAPCLQLHTLYAQSSAHHRCIIIMGSGLYYLKFFPTWTNCIPKNNGAVWYHHSIMYKPASKCDHQIKWKSYVTQIVPCLLALTMAVSMTLFEICHKDFYIQA